MEEKTVTVPYGDFIDGTKAMADLDSIRAIIMNGDGYCSDCIRAILGPEVKKEKNITFGNMLEEKDALSD